ncbi:MAG: hypothetical protein WCJ30_14375, partial [Deltaproteobacteria bacterium]
MTEATEVIVVVDTNAPSDRLTTLSATVRSGTSDAAVPQLWARGPDLPGSIQLPASFAIVPSASAPINAPITLALDLHVARGAQGEPELRFDRVARFQFTPHRTTVIRLFLPVECATRAYGCASAGPCTIARLCEEAGLTCGDDARCQSPVVIPVPTTQDDASAVHPRPDIVTPTADVTADVDATDATDALTDGPADADTDAQDATDAVDVRGVDSGACAPGMHECGGACVSDTSTATCGSSCTACPAPPHAQATCNGSTCGFGCDTGWADCD